MKIRNFILCFAFVCLISSNAGIKAQQGESWKASPAVVERLSKGRTDVNYYEEKVPSFTLPDPLMGNDGKKVSKAGDWTGRRREEVLEMFRANVFGRVPDTKYSTSFKVINQDNTAINGTATLKQVDISVVSGTKSLVIHLTLFTPNVKKPVPAFLLIDNRGPVNTDPTRQRKSEFWPVEEDIARGYAMAVFYNADVDTDNFDDFKNGIHGVIDN